MAKIEKTPGRNTYRVETLLPTKSLESLHFLGSYAALSTTDLFNQAVAIHKKYTHCKSLGGLLLARSETSLEVINKPNFSAHDFDDLTLYRFVLLEEHANYVQEQTPAEDEEIVFWAGAVALHSSVAEHQKLGNNLVEIHPDLTIYDYKVGVLPI
jgi:hypothetical protein